MAKRTDRKEKGKVTWNVYRASPKSLSWVAEIESSSTGNGSCLVVRPTSGLTLPPSLKTDMHFSEALCLRRDYWQNMHHRVGVEDLSGLGNGKWGAFPMKKKKKQQCNKKPQNSEEQCLPSCCCTILRCWLPHVAQRKVIAACHVRHFLPQPMLFCRLYLCLKIRPHFVKGAKLDL